AGELPIQDGNPADTGKDRSKKHLLKLYYKVYKKSMETYEDFPEKIFFSSKSSRPFPQKNPARQVYHP
ncbi:MAG: hypothetical protein J6M57_08205, partial [Acidaminococcaceae bacterium]|nr:hypothetical protein [Acidaminococcaceae bacterium]